MQRSGNCCNELVTDLMWPIRVARGGVEYAQYPLLPLRSKRSQKRLAVATAKVDFVAAVRSSAHAHKPIQARRHNVEHCHCHYHDCKLQDDHCCEHSRWKGGRLHAYWTRVSLQAPFCNPNCCCKYAQLPYGGYVHHNARYYG